MSTQTSQDIPDLPSDPTPPMLTVSDLVGVVWIRRTPEADWLKLRLGQNIPDGAEIAATDQGSCTLAVARPCIKLSGDKNKKVQVNVESNFPECLHLATNCCDVEVRRYEIMTPGGTVAISSALGSVTTASA